MDAKALGDALPFWHCEEDGTMVYADDSLGYGFELGGIDIGCAPNESINGIASRLEGLLCSMAEGWKLQVYYRLYPRVKGLLEKHAQLSKNAPDSYAPLRESRLGFLEGREFFIPKIFLFLRGRPHGFSKRKFWEGEKMFEKISMEEFREHGQNCLKVKKRLFSTLQRIGVNPRALSREEWFALIFEYLNLERMEKFGVPRLKDGIFADSFSSQATLTDMVVHGDSLEIGKYRFGAVTLKSLPEGETYAAMVEGFLNILPFHVAVSQTVEIPDQKKEMARLGLQRRLANSMARGSKNLSDLESESRLRHIEELLTELLEGGRRIVNADFNVILWGGSQEELDEKRDTVRDALRRMGGSEGTAETLPLFDAFTKAAPGACEGFRAKRMKSDNCAHLMPVYSGWKGNKKPVCLFENRDGGLVGLDPFTGELPSWNSLVFAASGSGKSFAVLQMAIQFYGQKPTPRIVWIDNGASSGRALDPSILDGQFIDLSLDSPICLNMFDLPNGETAPRPGKIKLILAILERILAEEGKGGLPKRHKALLEEAIYQAYETKKVPVLSDLRKILEEHDSKDMVDYGKILFSWTGGRAYGRLLDGKTNANLEKDLITIEIKGLDTYPDLQNVMLLNFTEFIKSKASEDSSRSTLLIIDEAWKMLETPTGKAFTIEAYRTFRKFGGGIWCISQNYKDFLRDEETATSILPNTSGILVLKQSKIDWKDFGKRLQLNEAEVEAVKSLTSVKGEYAEVFLMQDTNRAILRITADPLAYWIATTDPGDKETIREVRRENPNASQLEILQTITNQKGGA